MKKQLFIIGIGTLNILHAGFHLLQFVQSALLVSNSLDHNHGFEGILHNPYFAVVWAIVGIVTLWIGIEDFKHHRERDKMSKLLDEIKNHPLVPIEKETISPIILKTMVLHEERAKNTRSKTDDEKIIEEKLIYNIADKLIEDKDKLIDFEKKIITEPGIPGTPQIIEAIASIKIIPNSNNKP